MYKQFRHHASENAHNTQYFQFCLSLFPPKIRGFSRGGGGGMWARISSDI
jgi:hypothetical protein